MWTTFPIVFLAFFAVNVYALAAVSKGDPCDGRITKWCDFDAALWCRADKCKCVHNFMYFDTNRQKCLSKVWFPCGDLSTKDVDMAIIECVENAQCVTSKPNSECRCKRGFRENDDGFCVAKITMENTA